MLTRQLQNHIEMSATPAGMLTDDKKGDYRIYRSCNSNDEI